MKDTIYYLASCETCRKIIKLLPSISRLVFHDIRQNPLLNRSWMRSMNYLGIMKRCLSKKAQLYKEWDLKNKHLTEVDFRKYLLEHYTFLSRPVFVIDDKIYIGNSQKNILEVQKVLAND